jgi:hypothetical protein
MMIIIKTTFLTFLKYKRKPIKNQLFESNIAYLGGGSDVSFES